VNRTVIALLAGASALIPTASAHADSGPWSYSDCATDADFDLHVVQVTPDPPTAGRSFRVLLDGRVLRPVEPGARAEIEVHAGPVTVVRRTYPLDQEVPLPLTAGPSTLPFDFPDGLPRDAFRTRLEVSNADGSAVACVALNLDLR
jgi:hypothetical protein